MGECGRRGFLGDRSLSTLSPVAEKSVPAGAGTPPVLPDVESMAIDVDFFNQTPAAIGSPALQTPGLHWTTAALAVTGSALAGTRHR